jgi:hypothetical protein
MEEERAEGQERLQDQLQEMLSSPDGTEKILQTMRDIRGFQGTLEASGDW